MAGKKLTFAPLYEMTQRCILERCERFVSVSSTYIDVQYTVRTSCGQAKSDSARSHYRCTECIWVPLAALWLCAHWSSDDRIFWMDASAPAPTHAFALADGVGCRAREVFCSPNNTIRYIRYNMHARMMRQDARSMRARIPNIV